MRFLLDSAWLGRAPLASAPGRYAGIIVLHHDRLLAALPGTRTGSYQGGWWLPRYRMRAREDFETGLLRRLHAGGAHQARIQRRIYIHEQDGQRVEWFLIENLDPRLPLRPPPGFQRVEWIAHELLARGGESSGGQNKVLADFKRYVTTSWAPPMPTLLLSLGGLPIAYSDVGPAEAPPLVLVHGLGSDRQVFRWNIPHWAENRRILSLDLPGHGQSGKDLRLSLPLMVDTLRRFISSFKLGPVDLLGYSMGGFVATQLAAEHPDLIRRLVLLAPAGQQMDRVGTRRLKSVADMFRSPFYPYIRDTLFKRRFPSFYHRWMPEIDVLFKETLELRDAIDFRLWLRGVGDMIESMGRSSARDLFSKINAPTLVLHGARDRIIPALDSAFAARAIPNATLDLIPDCGHTLVIEERDRVTDKVREFLTAKNPGNDSPAIDATGSPASQPSQP